MLTAQRRALFTALDTVGFAAGVVEHTTSPAWPAFAGSWDRLPPDRFMADGGTYRERRFSEFRCDGDLELLPHRSFSQPRTINRLNGGVERRFAPFEPATAASPVLRDLLLGWVRVLDEVTGTPAPWLAQCFQNRTLARPDRPGLPTPEGRHRDGMDYNAILLVSRRGVVGGTNTVYAGDSGERLGQVLLAAPGEYLVTDDRRLLHDATPVALAGEAATGHRDAFVVSFTRL